MAIQAQNTELSVTPGGIIPVVHVSQYDVDRVLTFTLMDGNNAASLPSGAGVTIEGTKPSRHGFSYNDASIVSVASNTVTVNTVQQMTVEAGTVECKIKITAGDQVIGTALFFMEVEQAGVNDSTIVSDTELPLIIAMATAQMNAAAASASAANNSKNAAAASETAAKISEINAAASEYAARRSELNAATSENAARGYADIAETSSIQAQAASSVAVSAASDADTNNAEAKALLLEAKQKLIDTVFTVDFDTGDLTYTSTDSYTFTINTTTGNLEWEVAA